MSQLSADPCPSYRYPTDEDEGEEDNRLSCIIAPPHALMMAILNGTEYGLAMDSSWRNKNAFRCPVTMLTTLTPHHHMTPGTCFYSPLEPSD